MLARRMPSSRPVRSAIPAMRPGTRRSSAGITRSLDTIVPSASVSTATIPVAADTPPTKASTASQDAPALSGRSSTIMSALCPDGSTSTPASAIGSTNRLMSRRYRGKPQIAWARSVSRRFSTTIMWNCLGRQNAAAIDSSSSAVQSAGGTANRVRPARSARAAAGEQIGEAAEQYQPDEQPHRRQTHELDHRIEGYRGHEAWAVRAEVGMARTKQYGEHGKQHGGRERHIAGGEARPCRRQQKRQALGHGLELQRDVGHRAGQHHQRDQPREPA